METIQISGSTDFMRNSHINVLSKQVLTLHFPMFPFPCYMLYVREINEKFLGTLLLMFISSCYFLYNHVGHTAANNEFDLAVQMTMEHVSSEIIEKEERNGQKKVTFNKTYNI